MTTTTLKTSMMRRQCAWCKCELPSVPCVPEMENQVSHSICRKCAVDVLEKAGLEPEPAVNPVLHPMAVLLAVCVACLLWSATVHHFHLFKH